MSHCSVKSVAKIFVVLSGHVAMVEYLISAGCHVTPVSTHTHAPTPLSLALSRPTSSMERIVHTLYLAGAVPSGGR